MIFNMIAQAAASSGLEYEEGTYTLTEDTNQDIEIPYTNSHSRRATITLFCRDLGGEYNSVTNTMYYALRFESSDFMGEPYYGAPEDSTPRNQSYGIGAYKYRASSATAITQQISNIGVNTGGSNEHLIASPQNTNRYWRAGTYKWIAIWI